MPPMEPIEREDFERIQDPNLKLNILFSYIRNINDALIDRKEGCDKRFKELENRKWKDRSISTVTGFLGGFFYWLLKGWSGR